jgi:hypothetical protein
MSINGVSLAAFGSPTSLLEDELEDELEALVASASRGADPRRGCCRAAGGILPIEDNT